MTTLIVNDPATIKEIEAESGFGRACRGSPATDVIADTALERQVPEDGAEGHGGGHEKRDAEID